MRPLPIQAGLMAPGLFGAPKLLEYHPFETAKFVLLQAIGPGGSTMARTRASATVSTTIVVFSSTQMMLLSNDAPRTMSVAA